MRRFEVSPRGSARCPILPPIRVFGRDVVPLIKWRPLETGAGRVRPGVGASASRRAPVLPNLDPRFESARAGSAGAPKNRGIAALFQ